MKITPGKLAGLKAVSTDTGTIAAAAMDQRGSLKKALAKARGRGATDAMMEEFKAVVTEVLRVHHSAGGYGVPHFKTAVRIAQLATLDEAHPGIL